MGISVREVSRLKGGVYSFLTVYNTSYVVKKTAEIWAKECENGVQKKVAGHFLIKTGLELALPAYDIVPWTFECILAGPPIMRGEAVLRNRPLGQDYLALVGQD